MSIQLRPWHLVLLVVLCLGAAPVAGAKEKVPNFVQDALAGVTLGPGQATHEIIIFPLIAAEKPGKTNIKPDRWAQKIGFSEPEFPKRRFNVGVANNETGPLLILGGTILGGGTRDRVAPNDVIVPSGGRVEINTIVAAGSSDHRKIAMPFQIGSALAPPYIRERAEFHPSNNLIPSFVSHFLRFRNEGDKRKSLSAVNASTQLSQLCLPCHESLAAFPNAAGGRVVGLVTAVRGRIRSLEMFATNRLFKAYFEALLKSHTFAAAAIALQSKRLKLAIPGKGDPEKAIVELRAKAEKLLAQLVKARFRESDAPKGSAGEYLVLRTNNSTRGVATGLAGRLIHMAVFPYEPFEHALFSRTLKPPKDPSQYGEEGISSLENKRRHGRLTEAERRWLDRRRGLRRGGGIRIR